MGTTWETQIKVAKGIIVFNLIVIIFGTVLLEDWRPFVIGNTLGFTAAIVNFRLLAKAIERSLTMAPGNAVKYVRNRALLRLFINGVIIYVSLVSRHINTVGTVIGLLSIKPVILIGNLLYEQCKLSKNHRRKEED